MYNNEITGNRISLDEDQLPCKRFACVSFPVVDKKTNVFMSDQHSPPTTTSDESEDIDRPFHSLDVIAEYRPIDISSVKLPQRQHQQKQHRQQLSPKHRLIWSDCNSKSLPQRHEPSVMSRHSSQENSDSPVSQDISNNTTSYSTTYALLVDPSGGVGQLRGVSQLN